MFFTNFLILNSCYSLIFLYGGIGSSFGWISRVIFHQWFVCQIFFYILVFLSSYLIWVIYKIFKYHYMGLIDNVMGVLVSWKIFELIWFSGIYDIFLRLVLQLKKLYKISRHIFHSWNIQLHFSLRELSIDMWFIVIGH